LPRAALIELDLALGLAEKVLVQQRLGNILSRGRSRGGSERRLK
jgi:hypothetical protein